MKNLRTLFDLRLSWDAHVNDAIRKCAGLLIGLRHLSQFLTRRAVTPIVQVLVVSRVRYCISEYDSGSASSESRLIKVINSATHVITCLCKFGHVSRARDTGACSPFIRCVHYGQC